MSYDDSIIRTYESKGYTIAFQSVIRPSAGQIKFPAFLTEFSDNYNSNWGSDSIFGRHDPIYMFSQTTREISFTIDIPSASPEEGQKNFINVKNLAKFLYPSYSSVEGSNIIKNTPLMRIRFSNLIGKGFNRKNGHILGRIKTISISPNIEAGFYDVGKSIYPKVLNLSVSIDVMHEEAPGYIAKPEDEKPKPKQKEEEGILITGDPNAMDPQRANYIASQNQKNSIDAAKSANQQTVLQDGRAAAERNFGGEIGDNRNFNAIVDAAQTLGSTK
jgi:hypothetical protein